MYRHLIGVTSLSQLSILAGDQFCTVSDSQGFLFWSNKLVNVILVCDLSERLLLVICLPTQCSVLTLQCLPLTVHVSPVRYTQFPPTDSESNMSSTAVLCWDYTVKWVIHLMDALERNTFLRYNKKAHEKGIFEFKCNWSAFFRPEVIFFSLHAVK